jgi:hypothetical protein
MNDFDYINPLWRLADPLTVEQAAALIAGYDPNFVRYNAYGGIYFEDENGQTNCNGSHWVQTALAALKNAISAGNLKTKIIHDTRPIGEAERQTLLDMMECGEYHNPGYEDIAGDDEHFCEGYFIKNSPDWEKCLIAVDELREWLLRKGFSTGFLFPNSTNAPDYLDPKNPRYAPKLAAAVRAWQTVIDPQGKTPKQAITKWLREHASEFGLSDDEGKPNETGIEEVSKVANWQPGGGAPKTPGG